MADGSVEQSEAARVREASTVRPETVRFTQRELRETLHWQDRALRRQLSRLVQLEYVVAYPTGRGNQRAYQLVQGPDARPGRSGCGSWTPRAMMPLTRGWPCPRTSDSPTPRQPTTRREPIVNRHSKSAAIRRGPNHR